VSRPNVRTSIAEAEIPDDVSGRPLGMGIGGGRGETVA